MNGARHRGRGRSYRREEDFAYFAGAGSNYYGGPPSHGGGYHGYGQAGTRNMATHVVLPILEFLYNTIRNQFRPVENPVTAQRTFENEDAPTGNSEPTLESRVWPVSRAIGGGTIAVVFLFVFLSIARVFLWWMVVVTCFVHPMWRTMRAMSSPQRELLQRWASYWLFVGSFLVLDLTIFSHARKYSLYPALLFFGFGHFRRDEAANASLIYETHIAPRMQQNAAFMEDMENRARDLGSTVAQHILDTTHRILEPYTTHARNAQFDGRSATMQRPVRIQRRPVVEIPDDDDDDEHSDPTFHPPVRQHRD